MKSFFPILFGVLLFGHGLRAGELLTWEALPPIPNETGVAGPFTGIHEEALIVAGGANFPGAVWEVEKVWHDEIFVLPLGDGEPAWKSAGKLPKPLGYGTTVSLPEGILCIGGNDASSLSDSAFLLKWNGQEVEVEVLPNLPTPVCYAAAVKLGNFIYLAGGQHGPGLDSATSAFLRLDWSKRSDPEAFLWESLADIPGEGRAFHSLVTQSNGRHEVIYLLGGRHVDGNGEVKFLPKVFQFDPLKKEMPWTRKADLPTPLAAGTVAAVGQSHLVTLAGADGSLFAQSDEMKDRHPGFPKSSYAYHTITDTWIEAGQLPQNQVTTEVVAAGDKWFLISGEVRPRVRTPDVWKITPLPGEVAFAAANWVAIVLYLGGVIGIGVFFSRRNKSTDDFFRGGQRVPSWVAGLSIFATLLSSITFIALPARAFATDWVMMVVNAGILICAPLVVLAIIPKFRNFNVTSAYEYLESRFHLSLRLFAGMSFVLFQIGRMAIVMFLPALALATITPLSVEQCILVMGVLSILYCSIGGLEAVVWTDALQSIVLLGGAFLSFVIILMNLDGGWAEYTTVALTDHKFRWADFDFGSTSYLTTAFWVVLLGGVGSSLIPYSSDQAVVQRYVSTPSEKEAQSAIWLNAVMSAVATLLFFGLGTGLYVFYKANPGGLDPTFPTDSIFPLFISRELPVGVAGVVIAAVFAAAQSTISSSMNSTSTVIVTDFFRRLGWEASERAYLRLARILTVVLGTVGTLFALVLAWSEIESAWQTFLMIIGFVMGPLCGLFLLGMFTKSGNTRGAIVGVVFGVTVLVWARFGTDMHGLLYAPLGVSATWLVGWVMSRSLSGTD
ncbi:MAG: sodium/solute symporter [Verrucomicrobiales bacterium]|nr:sodium/solute symporter [Verrucomicrobiales bacterium]